MADDKGTTDPAEALREATPAETARAKAFFEDTIEALESAHIEGWDTDRTNAELTAVQRAHSYWSDTPVLGGKVGVDAGLASAGVTADANGAVGNG